MMSALIFVLQMINFPIAAGTSGHLLGGALAVIVLGPSLGIICISIVVVIQSLLFADGGLSALGVNLLNMAVVTSLIGWLVISTWKKLFNESYSSIISGSFIAGLLSVVFSSIAFVLEYAIGGTVAVPLGSVLIAMVSSHVLIGIGEGIITGLIVSLLLRVLYHFSPIICPTRLKLFDKSGCMNEVPPMKVMIIDIIILPVPSRVAY